MTFYKARFEGEEGAYSGKKGHRTLYFQAVTESQQKDPRGTAEHLGSFAYSTRGLAFKKLVSLKKIPAKQYFDEQYGKGYYEDVINPGTKRMERLG